MVPARYAPSLRIAPSSVQTRPRMRARSLNGLGCTSSTDYQNRLRRAAGLGALGQSAKVSGAASGAATGASIGSVVPVVGTAVGAVVGAVAGALFSKKKDPNKAEKEALKGQLDDYTRTMGQIPGRAFGLNTLKQLFDGAGQKGMWPNVKKWSGDAITGAIDGCKGCTPPPLRDWVKTKVSEGIDNPITMADLWTQHVNQTWGSKWLVASAGSVQRQLIIDLMDYFIAQYKPDAPLYYAPSWTVAAQMPSVPTVIAPPTPTPLPLAPSVPPAPTQSAGVPIAPAQPVTPSAQTQAVASDPNLAAMIQSLQAQGMSQQQVFQAAMAALGNQGVALTPQVQEAVANQVQAGGVSGIPQWALLAAAGVAVMFALARPRGRRS